MSANEHDTVAVPVEKVEWMSAQCNRMLAELEMAAVDLKDAMARTERVAAGLDRITADLRAAE